MLIKRFNKRYALQIAFGDVYYSKINQTRTINH